MCSLRSPIPLIAIHIARRCQLGWKQHDTKENRARQDDEESGRSGPKPIDQKYGGHIEDAGQKQEPDELRYARLQVRLPRNPPEDRCQPRRQRSEAQCDSAARPTSLKALEIAP